MIRFFERNPSNNYWKLKESIPLIKIKNKDFMNTYHKMNMSIDFWWALSGEYALLAEHLVNLSIEEPRILNELKNAATLKLEVSKDKVVDLNIINLIGREYFLDKQFEKNKKDTKVKVDDLLFEINSKDSTISGRENLKRNDNKLFIPMKGITDFLHNLKLLEIKNVYLKIKRRIKLMLTRKSNYNLKLYRNNSDKTFETALQLVLPLNMDSLFPKWFVVLSNYLVNSNHKWKTYFGLELNIYQKILIARSFQKYREKNIEVIPHGFLTYISPWLLYRQSLFPKMNLNICPDFYLKKPLKANVNQDILFCPPQFPWLSDFFSLNHFWEFMKVYKNTIKLLNSGLKNGKKIKIRYKSFSYLSGNLSPFTIEECDIPIETEKFEDICYNYKTIISMPCGTISQKCYLNNINCISYNKPFHLMLKYSYIKYNSYPGVFDNDEAFLKEVERKIKD